LINSIPLLGNDSQHSHSHSHSPRLAHIGPASPQGTRTGDLAFCAWWHHVHPLLQSSRSISRSCHLTAPFCRLGITSFGHRHYLLKCLAALKGPGQHEGACRGGGSLNYPVNPYDCRFGLRWPLLPRLMPSLLLLVSLPQQDPTKHSLTPSPLQILPRA